MKSSRALYNVQATRDGIIVFVFPRRKPTQRRRQRSPKIDAAACYVTPSKESSVKLEPGFRLSKSS